MPAIQVAIGINGIDSESAVKKGCKQSDCFCVAYTPFWEKKHHKAVLSDLLLNV
jgi:hypothetical protein